MSYESLLAEQVPELLEQDDVVVLDTRDPHSFAQGHLPNAKPADEANIARLIRGRNNVFPYSQYPADYWSEGIKVYRFRTEYLNC